VRDVDDNDFLSAMQVLLNNTIGVENGNVVIDEGEHLSLELIHLLGFKGNAIVAMFKDVSDNLLQHLLLPLEPRQHLHVSVMFLFQLLGPGACIDLLDALFSILF
jgi:hypothetical protein